MILKLILINSLTLIRIIGTIILIPIYNKYGGLAVGILASICYLTDCIDGYLARKLNASTFFGALFDGIADKLFTIINFIVLYLITPYALIPIIFEIAIILIQLLKYVKNLNVKSNLIGKVKVWVLAFCVVLTFIVSDINNISLLPINIREIIFNLQTQNLYLWLLLPAIIMEFITFISYFIEIFNSTNEVNEKNIIENDIKKSNNSWENFKNSWLNPKFYDNHKYDSNLKDLRKLSSKKKFVVKNK